MEGNKLLKMMEYIFLNQIDSSHQSSAWKGQRTAKLLKSRVTRDRYGLLKYQNTKKKIVKSSREKKWYGYKRANIIWPLDLYLYDCKTQDD